MAAKCCSSPAISAGSALADRRPGRSNALVVSGFTKTSGGCPGLQVARAHRKVRNARRDFLHRASIRLVRSADTIVIEDLNVAGMVRNRRLARAISDCGWGEFRRQLEYKCQRAGRELVVLDRWYPSSKTCSACGHLLAELSLGTRRWACPSCGARHDRDLNAAKNILAAGLAVARGSPGDACGADVRHSGSSRVQSAVKQEPRPARAGIPVLQGGEWSSHQLRSEVACNHWAQQGAWAGVTHLVAMTSNAPPDVDPVVVAGSGRQVLQVLASAGDSTARPGSCRKPPGALYVESGGVWALPFPFPVRRGRTTSSRSGAPRSSVPSAQEALP